MVEPQHPPRARADAARNEAVRLRSRVRDLIQSSEARIRRSTDLLSASAERLAPDQR